MPTPPAPLILLVEDEPHIADIQLAYLEQAGFRTHHLQRGDEVLPFLRGTRPDAILLDVMLPGMDGTAVCRELRQFCDVPVIMVTARVEEIDRLLGFEVGADDYLCKPFSPRELVMRVKALLRRYAPAPAVSAPSLQLDAEQQRAFWNGKRLELTAQQFRLLQVLSSRPGRVFSRAQLLELAYADDAEVSDRAIDSLIKNLRKRLAAEVPGQEFIHSVYGVGYRYEIEPA
jgi:two-component system response regulator BaeR